LAVSYRAPAAAFHHGGEEHFGVLGSGQVQVVPDEAGLAVRVQHVDAESVCLGPSIPAACRTWRTKSAKDRIRESQPS
jgi:hypothetical protein